MVSSDKTLKETNTCTFQSTVQTKGLLMKGKVDPVKRNLSPQTQIPVNRWELCIFWHNSALLQLRKPKRKPLSNLAKFA